MNEEFDNNIKALLKKIPNKPFDIKRLNDTMENATKDIILTKKPADQHVPPVTNNIIKMSDENYQPPINQSDTAFINQLINFGINNSIKNLDKKSDDHQFFLGSNVEIYDHDDKENQEIDFNCNKLNSR